MPVFPNGRSTRWIFLLGPACCDGRDLGGPFRRRQRGSELDGDRRRHTRTGRVPQPAIENFDPKQTSVFTDKETFLDAVVSRTISLESFEELAATNRIDFSTIAVDGFSITTDNPPQLGIWNRLYQGAFATDGHQWMGVEENELIVPQVTTLSFDSLINHFGFYTTDFGDFGDGNLVFANEVGDEATAAFSGEPSGNRQFFGIINSARAFRTVTLTHSVRGSSSEWTRSAAVGRVALMSRSPADPRAEWSRLSPRHLDRLDSGSWFEQRCHRFPRFWHTRPGPCAAGSAGIRW